MTNLSAFLTTFLALPFISLSSANAEATAPTSESKTSLTEIKKEVAPAKSQDLDAEVQDIKLRADSGKKSKYSSSFFLTYSGASLHKPNDEFRPNVSGDRRVDEVNLSGIVGVRYRKNKNESFFAATGISRDRPFHSSRKDESWDVSTPQISYNKTHAIEALQISSNVRAYFMTESFYRDIGQLGTLGYSLTAKNRFGQSRFSGGVSMNFSYAFFDKSEDSTVSVSAGPQKVDIIAGTMQRDYGMSFSPQVQFTPNERSYIYTSWSLLNYSHYRSDAEFKMDNANITQSVGVGFAIARDFFVSPYLTFDPSEMSRKLTSVNLTTSINL